MPISNSSPLSAALAALGLSTQELYVDQVGLGGNLTFESLQDFLAGERGLTDHDYDVLVQAVNDHFVDQGNDHPLAYSSEL